MVAAENPVASLIRLIVVFIDSSPFVFCLSDCINIIINILNNFAIFFIEIDVSLYNLDDLFHYFMYNITIYELRFRTFPYFHVNIYINVHIKFYINNLFLNALKNSKKDPALQIQSACKILNQSIWVISRSVPVSSRSAVQ